MGLLLKHSLLNNLIVIWAVQPQSLTETNMLMLLALEGSLWWGRTLAGTQLFLNQLVCVWCPPDYVPLKITFPKTMSLYARPFLYICIYIIWSANFSHLFVHEPNLLRMDETWPIHMIIKRDVSVTVFYFISPFLLPSCLILWFAYYKSSCVKCLEQNSSSKRKPIMHISWNIHLI